MHEADQSREEIPGGGGGAGAGFEHGGDGEKCGVAEEGGEGGIYGHGAVHTGECGGYVMEYAWNCRSELFKHVFQIKD